MRNLIIVILVIMSTSLISAQGVQQEGYFNGKIIREASMIYLLYLPENFDLQADISWPMLVFLHGSGERGNEIEKVKVHGPPKLIAQGHHFPFMVLSPQCPDNQDWDTELLYALIRNIASRYKADEKRIYVTGLSMGGSGTWDLAVAYPDYFAAIAPVCGPLDRNHINRAEELKHLPVWAFHGAMDDVVPLTDAAKMIKQLQDIGGNAKITIYPDANHDSWTVTYDNQELYDWLLKQKKL
ncbi:MAG: prolyl oligopeptidase family serine peptidase [Lentimicrobium sp.]|nr:prolyl oligopeptidase family serine peptidase [Lentimicrobium sp.]